jgi:integrase
LIVSPSGARRWRFIFTINKIKDSMGLGSADTVTWQEAKDAAINAKRLLAKEPPVNPKHDRDEKRRAEGTELFYPFARRWADTMKTGLKGRASKAKLERIVEVVTKPLHKMSMQEIDTTHIVAVLESVWHLREASRDTRQRIKVIFDAAIARGVRTKTNPADWASRLKPNMAKQKKRGRVRGSHKSLPHEQLPALMQKLAGINTLSARALETTILTLVRTIETRNMQWSQLDLDTGLWNLNFDDTKNDRAKRTPLPKQTLAYLHEAYKERVSEFVFPGRNFRKPMSENTMLKMIKQITGDDTMTVHGFRSTFRTWAQEDTDFEKMGETVEHCMHHILGDDAEKVYKTGEALRKRRIVMQTFADFATTTPSGKVVAMKRSAA